MSGITVLSPLGINRVGSQPLAPRLSSLDGVKLGLLNNSKPNSLELQRHVVELLAKQHPVAGVVTMQKPSAAIGAEGLDAYAKEVGAVTAPSARAFAPTPRSDGPCAWCS